MTTHKEALEAAYLAGFNASGEGYNGEYPFGDKMQDPAENRVWKKDRDNYIKEALAQPEQEPVAKLFGTLPIYDTPQRTWVGLMRGVRVEGDTVVISTKNNDAARELCGELINEIDK